MMEEIRKLLQGSGEETDAATPSQLECQVTQEDDRVRLEMVLGLL